MQFYIKRQNRFILLAIMLLYGACSKETKLPATADFSWEVTDNKYSVPAHISFTNKSSGAEYYQWTFEGGNPASYDKADPGTVRYDIPGTYKAILEVRNRDGSSDRKEVSFKIDSAVSARYYVAFVKDSFPEATLQIFNQSAGSDSYNWIFEGGTPTTSAQQNPPAVRFADPGAHKIRLTVTNGRETFTRDTTIVVAPHLVADFDYLPDAGNEGWEAPVTLHMRNHCISATAYSWQSAGATTISAPAGVAPDITFTNPGTYTVQLTAANGKETQQAQTTVTVLPNTNLRVLHDLKLGINTAQNTIGCYFSTAARKVYPKDSLRTIRTPVDIVFYGLNSDFTFNRFIAPDQTGTVGLPVIPSATHTQLINMQELCGCGAAMSATAFDNMSNDALLQSMSISETAAGLQAFDNTLLPRVVLFRTAAGVKGAIKIKQYVDNGAQSYIIADMKYIKQP